jgi:hypothetical protein
MSQALSVVNFTAKIRQSLDLRFAESLSRIQVIEYDARIIAWTRIRLAVRRERCGIRPLL